MAAGRSDSSASSSARRPTVHLLVVHGVGDHDHLSNLLRTYQSFRANLTSQDVPVVFEDLIPGWRITSFDGEASPPMLRLEYGERKDPGPADADVVCLYEVNYSGLAGIVRRNHKVGLTELFLGLDQAVCAARQRMHGPSSSVFGAGTPALAQTLQRVSGVLAAGTVPIIGVPSLIFREYIGTFVATFTRFFEDVTSFALDKNGERLISAHLDHTLASIEKGMQDGDRLVIAAHSLGSVVVHNYVVRRWSGEAGILPDSLITFGSPIGLVSWLWLYLDFEDMDFSRPIRGNAYFCWKPVRRKQGPRQKLTWINVVNCLDPIATIFPTGSVDLSSGTWDIVSGLRSWRVQHHYFGDARISAVGASHTQYLNDKPGFVALLLEKAALTAAGTSRPGIRSDDEHRDATERVLRRTQYLMYTVAVAAIAAYCALVAYDFGERRILWMIVPALWPLLTIEAHAFFQRLFFGGPTKRISVELIQSLPWADRAAFPYRLREYLLRIVGRSRDASPMERGYGPWKKLSIKAAAFVPSAVGMLLPIVIGAVLTERWPTVTEAWSRTISLHGLAGLALFVVYVVACAAHELVGAWRRVVRTLR